MPWSLQDAKNRFSAVVDAALRDGPQAVTRRGRPAVVVVSASDYDRLRVAASAARPDFRAHLLAIPAGEDIPRAEARPRVVDLS
jgi:prevent-host-death family protein